MRSSTRRVVTAAVCALALVTAGCIASTDTRSELHATDGSGQIVIHLVMSNGDLSQAEAWWAENAPESPVELDRSQHIHTGLVLKNDVVVAEEPLTGSTSAAVFDWRSADSGALAEPGDEFEVLVMDENGATIASYELIIRA